jgi:hypothetical protein
MSTAYQYVGEDPRDYPGYGLRVVPGDIVRLEGRPPDGRFVPWSGQGEPSTAVAATEPNVREQLQALIVQLHGGLQLDDEQLQEQLIGVDGDDPEQGALANEVLALVDAARAGQQVPRRPNKAASAEDWRAYAVAMGMSEEDAKASTRQALIDKYTEGV